MRIETLAFLRAALMLLYRLYDNVCRVDADLVDDDEILIICCMLSPSLAQYVRTFSAMYTCCRPIL